MPQAFKWEFPGGKINPKENEVDSIVREIKEELDIEVEIIKKLTSSLYNDGSNLINLIPFVCKIKMGEPKAIEHKQLHWCNREDCLYLDWCPADLPVVTEYWRLRENL